MISIQTVLEKDPKASPEYYAAEGVLSKLSATIARIFPLVLNEDGLISFSLSMTELKSIFESSNVPKWNMTDPILGSEIKNMFKVFSSKDRGSFLPSKNTSNRFKRGVPLFLAAFKEYKNIPYSKWDLTDPRLKMVIDPDNLEAIEYYNSGDHVDFDLSELETLRVLTLTTSAGVVASDTAYKCNLTKINKVFDSLPRMVRHALVQTWDYNPNRANEYLIRNFNDIDKPATYNLVPLLSDTSDLLVKKEKTSDYDLDKDTGDNPW
jgi:hypothetical protein